MTKRRNVYPLITVSLFLLFNPAFNILDILPDCIAYFLLILAIGKTTESVPYLYECKSALVKLAMITAFKIPAFSIMYSNMASGKDIMPLFTLTFVTVELILLYSAVQNGYRALSYIGERTDCSSVRAPFPMNRKSTSTPEALRVTMLVFFAIKGILNVLPEFLLLTPENAFIRRRMTEAYPAVLVISMLTVTVMGIIWIRHTLKYVKAIRKAGDIGAAIDSLTVKYTPEEEDKNNIVKKLLASLNALAISSFFIFDISLSDYGGYNILPHFIYGIILFIAIYSIATTKLVRGLSIISSAAFIAVSLVGYFSTARFYQTYSIEQIKYKTLAAEAYDKLKTLAVVETVLAVIMLTVAAMAMIGFIKAHTDVSPDDPAYSRTNIKNHQRAIRKALPIFIISAFISILKCINVFVKENTQIIPSEVNFEGITASSVPVLNTAIVLISIVYVVYCCVTVSNIKDEVKFKYDKE